MNIYQVRFAEEALADLARIFTGLLPVAGEPLARGFVARLEWACLKLATIYDVPLAHDVAEFLLTDRAQLPQSARDSGTDEQVLVAEDGDGAHARRVDGQQPRAGRVGRVL